MENVQNIIQMVKNIKVLINMEINKDMVFIIIKMVIIIKDNGKMICHKDMANKYLLMVLIIKVHGNKIKKMDKVFYIVLWGRLNRYGKWVLLLIIKFQKIMAKINEDIKRYMIYDMM